MDHKMNENGFSANHPFNRNQKKSALSNIMKRSRYDSSDDDK